MPGLAAVPTPNECQYFTVRFFLFGAPVRPTPIHVCTRSECNCLPDNGAGEYKLDVIIWPWPRNGGYERAEGSLLCISFILRFISFLRLAQFSVNCWSGRRQVQNSALRERRNSAKMCVNLQSGADVGVKSYVSGEIPQNFIASIDAYSDSRLPSIQMFPGKCRQRRLARQHWQILSTVFNQMQKTLEIKMWEQGRQHIALQHSSALLCGLPWTFTNKFIQFGWFTLQENFVLFLRSLSLSSSPRSCIYGFHEDLFDFFLLSIR